MCTTLHSSQRSHTVVWLAVDSLAILPEGLISVLSAATASNTARTLTVGWLSEQQCREHGTSQYIPLFHLHSVASIHITVACCLSVLLCSVFVVSLGILAAPVPPSFESLIQCYCLQNAPACHASVSLYRLYFAVQPLRTCTPARQCRS